MMRVQISASEDVAGFFLSWCDILKQTGLYDIKNDPRRVLVVGKDGGNVPVIVGDCDQYPGTFVCPCVDWNDGQFRLSKTSLTVTFRND